MWLVSRSPHSLSATASRSSSSNRYRPARFPTPTSHRLFEDGPAPARHVAVCAGGGHRRLSVCFGHCVLRTRAAPLAVASPSVRSGGRPTHVRGESRIWPLKLNVSAVISRRSSRRRWSPMAAEPRNVQRTEIPDWLQRRVLSEPGASRSMVFL